MMPGSFSAVGGKLLGAWTSLRLPLGNGWRPRQSDLGAKTKYVGRGLLAQPSAPLRSWPALGLPSAGLSPGGCPAEGCRSAAHLGAVPPGRADCGQAGEAGWRGGGGRAGGGSRTHLQGERAPPGGCGTGPCPQGDPARALSAGSTGSVGERRRLCLWSKASGSPGATAHQRPASEVAPR